MYDGLDTYYYFWANGSIMAEYLDRGSPGPRWTKSYFYAGTRLIFTTSRVNSTTEKKETHHPDRLGTKIVTNVDSGAAFEQSTLPFGTAFGAESSGYSNQVFTSYDRSTATGLDYANNRTYSSGQGRFTQVDPIGMSAASIGNPQSNNMYAYTQNMPTDFVDPSGLLAVPTTQCYLEVSGTVWTQGDQHLRTFITGTRMVCYQSNSSPQGFAGEGGGGSGPAVVSDNDCLNFVAEIETLVRGGSSATGIITELHSRYSPRDNNFGTRGFKGDYIDPTNESPDQIRHAVGALGAGFWGGVGFLGGSASVLIAGTSVAIEGGRSFALNRVLDFMNNRERRLVAKSVAPRQMDAHVVAPITRGGQADINLNGVMVPIGFKLGEGTLKLGDLAGAIRNAMCN